MSRLHAQSRGKLAFDEATQSFLPGDPAAGQRSAGACRGVVSLVEALADGAGAGAAAAGARGARRARASRARRRPSGGSLGLVRRRASQTGPRQGVRRFPERRHARDIALGDARGHALDRAHQALHDHGMATDQGKTSNLNALAIAAEALGKPIAEVGLTTFRLPYTPVTFGALAGLARGDLFDPIRETPLHGWSARQGANSKRRACGSAPPVSAKRGEKRAGDGAARVPGDARQRRHHGRFDARQDRGRRPGRRRVSQSALYQFLRQAWRSGAAATA